MNNTLDVYSVGEEVAKPRMTLFALAENSIQLVPDASLLLHMGIILLMLAVLNLTLFKPINRILEQRELLTRGRLNEAESALKRVKEMIARHEQQLREARAEGYHLMEQQKLELLREREQQVASVKKEIAGWVADQKEDLGRQAAGVRTSLAEESQRIGLEIGSQILGRPLSDPGTTTSAGRRV